MDGRRQKHTPSECFVQPVEGLVAFATAGEEQNREQRVLGGKEEEGRELGEGDEPRTVGVLVEGDVVDGADNEKGQICGEDDD
jgi:hypothetical protein